MKKLIVVMYILIVIEIMVVPFMGCLYQESGNTLYIWVLIGSIIFTFITSIITSILMNKFFNKAFKKSKEKESSKECPYFIEKEN